MPPTLTWTTPSKPVPDVAKGVVIRGAQVLELFQTYEEALEWAYEKFGLDGFFVKQISEEEPIAHFSRDLGTCGV